jgi:hypothetical protein
MAPGNSSRRFGEGPEAPVRDFIDYFQKVQIDALNRDLASIVSERGETTRQTAELRETVDRLVLACQAMWALLSKETGLDDGQLLQKIREIDLMDGTLDGKLRKQASTCPKCKRANGSRRQVCLYCGALIPQTKAF